jgi:hypothetical protein
MQLTSTVLNSMAQSYFDDMRSAFEQATTKCQGKCCVVNRTITQVFIETICDRYTAAGMSVSMKNSGREATVSCAAGQKVELSD